MANIRVKRSKLKAAGLVRDKDGKPKLKYKGKIPKAIWDMLTEDEKQEYKDYVRST